MNVWGKNLPRKNGKGSKGEKPKTFEEPKSLILFWGEEGGRSGAEGRENEMIGAKKIIGEGRGLDFKDNSGSKTVLRLKEPVIKK